MALWYSINALFVVFNFLYARSLEVCIRFISCWRVVVNGWEFFVVLVGLESIKMELFGVICKQLEVIIVRAV